MCASLPSLPQEVSEALWGREEPSTAAAETGGSSSRAPRVQLSPVLSSAQVSCVLTGCVTGS